ncbi:MAG TPA: glycoside hydrolase family 3 C-terminal domain-containing protein, partial [Rhizomicrobium sp.]|nr:glycoside hydrolase family 3 C-terminal domain-containing protein [Rhizomicrobium sp.]
AITGGDASGIDAAAALCDDADAVLLCLGEAATMSGEAASRAHLGLPGLQQQLADTIFARAQDKPVIVLLFSGRPLVIPDLVARAHALLAAWFPGSEAGNAIADVLTGRVSPSGKTPVSWPRAIGQIPIFFGQRPGGRPFNPADHYTSHYSDVDNTPQFPFGHGLSYGAFKISNLRLTTEGATVDVVNNGTTEAEETFFLFTRQLSRTMTRPVLELQGFARIRLAPAARGTLSIPLPASNTARTVFVGPSADPACLLWLQQPASS